MLVRRCVGLLCVLVLMLAAAGALGAEIEVKPPEGFTLLPDELPADFDFSFGVKPEAGEKRVAKALVNCLGPRDHYTVQVGADFLQIDRVRDGDSRKLARWGLAPQAGSPQVCLQRRGDRLTAICGERVLGTVTDGRLRGGRLAYGPAREMGRFADPRFQPIGPIYVTDDFMRTAAEQGAWEPLTGTWKTVTVGDPRLGSNPFSYAVVSPTPAIAATGYWFWDSYSVECAAKPPVDGQVGIAFYLQDKDNYLAFRWTPRTQQLISVVGGRESVLAERATGFAPGQWYRLGVDLDGDRIRTSIDGLPALETRCALFGQGKVGLYGMGATEAFFDDVEVKSGQALREELTPNQVTAQFSKEATMANWATQRGEWIPAPAPETDLSWNRNVFFGPCSASVRLTGLGMAAMKASLTIGAEACAPNSGYTLSLDCPASAKELSLDLSRAGSHWAGPFRVPVPAGGAATLRLARGTGEVAAAVESSEVARLRDRHLLTGTHVCMRAPQANVDWEAGKTEAGNSYDYTFARAPVDWVAQSGKWAVTNRWSCSPGWSWFGGHGRKLAVVWHKREFVGDVCLSYFGGVKMDADASEPYQQRFRDLNITICGDGVDPASGYAAIVGGWKNTRSALYRCGKLVGSSDKWHFPPYDGGNNAHRRWWNIRLEKAGSWVRLYVDNQLYLEYNDPQPLPGGRVAIWTADNGVMVARATIYYQAQSQRAMDYLACAPLPPNETGTVAAAGRGWRTPAGDGGVLVRMEPTQKAQAATCVLNAAGGGQINVTAPGAPFDAAKGGLISFDYRVPPNVRVNLYARARGVSHAIVLSGPDQEPAPVKLLGKLEGFVADDHWHRARFDLAAALRRLYPNEAQLPVEELVFANPSADPYELCGFGANPAGSRFWIANWLVLGEVPNMPVVSRPSIPAAAGSQPTSQIASEAPARGLAGLRVQFFQDADQGAFVAANLNTPVKWTTFTRPVLVMPAKQVDYSWGRAAPNSPLRATYWSARFQGKLCIPTTGDYTFYVDQLDDGARLYIDGALVVDSWLQQAAASHPSQPIRLTRGQHDLRLDYCQGDLEASVSLAWSGSDFAKEVIPAAVRQVASARTTLPGKGR